MGALEDKIHQEIRTAGIDFKVIDCDASLADTAVFCDHYGYAMEDSANTILVKSKTGAEQFVVCVLLATCKLDVNKTIRKKMGVRKASFASADETKAITGMEIGGVTSFALPSDLPLWIDARVMERPEIILGGGGRDSKIILPPAIYHHTANTEVVDGLALPLG